jgi:hypothetical protein
MASYDGDPVLGDPEVDAAVIATSTDTHADLIHRAAAAGKAILCEKPVDFALELAEAATLRRTHFRQFYFKNWSTLLESTTSTPVLIFSGLLPFAISLRTSMLLIPMASGL